MVTCDCFVVSKCYVCFSILGNCFITSVLDLWDYDKTVIETLTDEQIQEKINTTELK